MEKHHPNPIASASGCTTAMAAAPPRHLTMLQAPWAVADRWTFKSVSSVLVIWEFAVSHTVGEKSAVEKLTVKVLAVVIPVRNCMRIITEICFANVSYRPHHGTSTNILSVSSGLIHSRVYPMS